mgnify:CR=1 FL=1
MADDDIDLKSLSDDDLVKQMMDDLYDGLKEEIDAPSRPGLAQAGVTRKRPASGPSASNAASRRSSCS